MEPTMSKPKPKILFVDDEENVLRGLGRTLRARRELWDMRFASSGRQALELLALDPADVVVSDMRMPGMNGAELLAAVQKRYPSTVRIVLSGFADREAILKTIGPSHRYLAKPATDEVLVTAIESSLQLRKYLGDARLQQAIAGLSHLPTLPTVYSAILTELNSELGSAERLASIIENDISITAQLMKLTNSAYFSLPQKCTTIKQAIGVLGFDNVRAAVLLAGVFDQFAHLNADMLDVIQRLTQRSLAIGVLAQAIARHEAWNPETATNAFCAGLLAHVGTLLLIAQNAGSFRKGLEAMAAGHDSLIDIEERSFGASHAQLGAYLLGLWGFSDVIVEAVAFHHQPSLHAQRRVDVLTAVHAAQFLAGESRSGAARKESTDGVLDETYIENAGLRARVPEWRSLSETLKKEWSHA